MSFLRNKNILIIDDDRSLRSIVRTVLENSGATVYEARAVEEGISTARDHVPHLIIVDLKMPQVTGFDFLEFRRNDPTIGPIPVVVLSAVTDRAAVHKAISMGAINYIAKPIVASVLLRKVRKALKDRTYEVVTFGEEGVEITCTLQGTITMANEVGFLMEVPAKIAETTRVEVQSPLLKALEIQNCIYRRTERVGKSHEVGLYLNEVSVVGLNPDTAKKIHKTVKGWL